MLIQAPPGDRGLGVFATDILGQKVDEPEYSPPRINTRARYRRKLEIHTESPMQMVTHFPIIAIYHIVASCNTIFAFGEKAAGPRTGCPATLNWRLQRDVSREAELFHKICPRRGVIG